MADSGTLGRDAAFQASQQAVDLFTAFQLHHNDEGLVPSHPLLEAKILVLGTHVISPLARVHEHGLELIDPRRRAIPACGL